MKTKNILMVVLFVGVGLLACSNNSVEEGVGEEEGAVAVDLDLNDETQKVSYALGISIGKNLQQQKFESLNIPALAKGIADVYAGGPLSFTPQQVQQILNDYRVKLQQAEMKAAEGNNKVYLEEGRKFLEENKTKDGVVTLPSGLQYKVLVEGTGTASPGPADPVTVHYHGTLIDGTVFDSSVDRGQPAALEVNRVIAGWQQALPMMKIGDKWRLFIPTELAYGANPRPGIIKPNMALIFDVELISIDK